MRNIVKHLTTYEDSKIINELQIKPSMDIGEFFYDETWKNLYVITDVDLENELIIGMDIVDLSTKKIPEDAAFKAYFSSEIADLIPMEFSLPQRFPEGWACVTGDGEIIKYKDVTFFESEIQAFSKILIYLVRLNIIDIKKIYLK